MFFDLTSINPALVGIPLILAAVLLGWFGWQRHERGKAAAVAAAAAQAALEQARQLPLPEGSLELARAEYPDTDRTSLLAGKILLLLAGTFAASLGIRLLKTLAICELAEAVNSINLIEPDKGQRAKFLEAIPPVFLDRLVVVECAGLTGGGANRGRAWLEHMRSRWVSEVRAKAAATCDMHQRRGLARSQRSDEAAQVLAVISEGATGWMGLEALPVILRRFVGAQCIGLTAYPIDDLLSSQTPQLLQAWQAAGCEGIYVEANSSDAECPERDILANDLGMVTLISAPIAAAAMAHDAVAESNNMHTLVFGLGGDEHHAQSTSNGAPRNEARLASFRVTLSSLPAAPFQPHPGLDPRYFVAGDAMTSTTLTVLEEAAKPEHRAVSAAFGRPNTARFDIVMTPLEPTSLRALEDAVVTARKTSADPPPGRNYHLLFAGMKTRIDPHLPTCPLIAVSVEALTDPNAHLAQVATPRQALPTSTTPPLAAAGHRHVAPPKNKKKASHAA